MTAFILAERVFRWLQRQHRKTLWDVWHNFVHRRYWPAVIVKCYSCPGEYDATDLEACRAHLGHATPTRAEPLDKVLLTMLDAAQHDRDEWARAYSDAYRTGRFTK